MGVVSWVKHGYKTKEIAQARLEEAVNIVKKSGYNIHGIPYIAESNGQIYAAFQFINPDDKAPLKFIK